MKHFAKLIVESELISRIQGEISEKELKDAYLNPIFRKLSNHISKPIICAKLLKPHFYSFHIQIHAQEIEDEKL